MGGLISRRWVLAAGTAAVALYAANVAIRAHLTSARQAMRYEDHLAAQFKAGQATLRLMALAHIGGFAERLPGWLASAKQGHFEADAAPALQRVFDALLTGDVATIEAALSSADVRDLDLILKAVARRAEPSSAQWLDTALTMVADPLILLGRADLVPTLHANSLRRLGGEARSTFTTAAALGLAAAAEWEHALEVLQQARRSANDVRVETPYENLLWRYAYLHRRVDSAMPVLAEMPFSVGFPHLVEYRAWKLKAYQIRAGMPGIVVPVIEGEQPHGYSDAAAMQIAALADDPSAAELVANLRRVVQPRSFEFIHVDRGIDMALTMSPFSEAEAQIAARRKDHARLAILARQRSDDILTDPPNTVIDALLDEGDWRAAAEIAKEHDPRKRPMIPGFDDDRASRYVARYEQLALAAAWDGDDAAAALFLARARKVSREEGGGEDEEGGGLPRLSTEALLAGAAEGLLPRKYLYLFAWAFRTPF